MSTTTTRNSLVKPAYADAADVAVINSNMDLIDASFAKCNWASATNPGTSEAGYSVGSLWFDTTAHVLYACEVATIGAQVWRQIYPAGALNTASQITSTLADGTAPFVLTSKTMSTNLNADMVDGIHTATIIQSGGGVSMTGTLDSQLASGTAPITVKSTTMCTNLNADQLDGTHAAGFVTQALADAKGDLIVASAADTWARQAVSATDGDALVADASATNGVSWQPLRTGSMANLMINGDFVINQHAIATYTSDTVITNSDDTYLFDQWTLLSDGNDIVDVTRQTSGWPTGEGAKAVAFFETETANKKYGIIQFMTSLDCRHVIGGTVSLSFWAKTTAANPNANIMAGVLSWSSTADTVTSDVVSNWEATNTAPTLIANWTYENVPARLALVADTWTRYKIENISIDTANTVNLAVFIWLDDTNSAVDDTLYITGVQLNQGPTALPYSGPSYAEAMSQCKRFYMVWNTDAQPYGHLGAGPAHTTGGVYIEYAHPTAWFKTAAAVTMVGSWTGNPNVFESMTSESLVSTIVVLCTDNAKAYTADHCYLVYSNNDTTARVRLLSRL